MRIALGIARGLRYLHTELQPPFALTELGSTSIYLTEDFSPKVSTRPTDKILFLFSFNFLWAYLFIFLNDT
jgi:hypothetical protein